ncbi:lysophospholipase [Wolfiporia cocos MD-104 SS10]|uniref:Lysophospholipase n=1 Tax=Wolfiporia cocos (strain MD-104) TaxID=742152 RepID=A0A2H3JKR6_WOLCO|nr:lysophospholipase [Wolfiporia cocos MD-104 SS10]
MASEDPAYTEAWLAGFDGHQFYTRTYRAATSPPRAVLLFLHGFAEHVGRHEHEHTYWAARGITVFAMDERGFGRTALDSKRSKDAAYGKTCHELEMRDIEFWVRYLRKEYPDAPLFLMGHSMGGALALAFPTQSRPPPSTETVEMLSGVVSSSPLIILVNQPAKLLRGLGGYAAKIIPWVPFPAKVSPEDLSHDPAVNNAVDPDPLIKSHATFRQLGDMLNRGEDVLNNGPTHWPKKLPILIVHGDADKVTSHKASEQFIDRLDAEDKKLTLFPGGYHELTNEPDGVKEKFWDECIAWIHQRALAPGALAKL